MGKGKETIRAFIGVGSNIDAEANLARALELLQERLAVVAASPFYRSPAEGAAGQADFANGVFIAETSLPPRALKLEVLRPLEAELGRARTADKNAARTIDLDLVLYGGLRIDEPGLVVPDPGIRRYPFVALPLLDLAPELVLPGTGERLKDLFPGRPEEYGLVLLPRLSGELQSILNKKS